MGWTQRYGRLVVGPGFWFVFDVTEAGPPLLYVDANRNNDLTDDPGPVSNQGSSGVFAAGVLLPAEHAAPGLKGADFLQIWLFSGESAWGPRVRQPLHHDPAFRQCVSG